MGHVMPQPRPAPDSRWLTEQIVGYQDAELSGDDKRQREIFLQVVNRCAQLSRWAGMFTPNVPAHDDDQWVKLAEYRDEEADVA